MALLLRCRFPATDTQFPLANYGVDAFGPFFIVNGKQTEKHYSLIFTCLIIRACHLEFCPASTTDSFINAFRRFIARRRQPQYICSNNGKTFVGARRELQEALNAGIRTTLQTPPLASEMEWHLNPPFAPQVGEEDSTPYLGFQKTYSRTVSHNHCRNRTHAKVTTSDSCCRLP